MYSPQPQQPDVPESDVPTEEINRRLREQYAEMAFLAGRLAHEIRNPLSTIRLNMELLQEDFAESETPRDRRAKSKFQVIQREVQRLENLLNDFLAFARLRHLKLAPCNLNEVVERSLEFFGPKAQESGIEIVRYLAPDLPTVLIDRETFHAAMLNLLLNAQQAMPSGGRLEVRTRLTGRGAALDLIDTGIGMDADTMARIFEVFYSTKREGSGLGLPTTKRIVEALGGRIGVQSEPGTGTQFTIELPAIARIEASAAE